ncbi:MAG: nucleotidyl transferase AbiEii/AbiGii toxin family protein [Pseudanabaena sp.]|jgi:predicted nucleotidyltransferase component of viral defense system|uniref:nucleotidyl transferase AbiEii/AbiGii toxin family protein n=1 Tax=Pseudanabaena mucicola TaxID=71190 RepID=UPI00257745B0|nr:nucleotidyl transferase AbiEii/AbiGii toxin family protein [Pseudanabaena mucicola]MCA6573918.1 nucleotidyl transferase AbiEii/AbiGii toxin family protein [Pseudanabaena sp. M53BS1SP1A06MG]MCA6582916.1 nucleotidyl transferase AbiEii/AbiGii toxin family protein [Pseudanabaena sp. M34BS1SP1A06MG]MCA6590954.1 nucleotidyl transferase AbiEii/AbiGii toxin family protein [Pseudanabaena sp. M38BS1SP1A06MG]MCA6595204.1 nucleotidyl transferase AbiEii/AbiGii toxin family protein [Pseudanabaena sp. M046
MSEIEGYDIKDWVEEASTTSNKEFRQAVHTILSSIASDSDLKANMILKGGILLAIRYKSHRFTTDIDFSTEKPRGGEITEDGVRKSLDSSLAQMVEELDYDLDCRVQSSKLQPRDVKSTYPSIKMKVGYAYKGTPQHKRLLSLQSPNTISIDYSLNEATPNIEDLKLNLEEGILAYSLTDLIAEKYRSLLQQVSRNRNRRQDVYDINLLVERFGDINDFERSKILNSLIIKSKAREISPDINSFEDPDLKSRAQKDYHTLKDEIESELPDFDDLFQKVSDFYRSLPWS